MNDHQAQERGESTIALGDIWRALTPLKYWMACGALLGLCGGLGFTLTVTPVYEATVTMLPTKSPESSNGLGGIASQVGGLAALAGINLQTNDNAVGSGEYLRSKSLAREFLQTHKVMPLLYPNRWDEARQEGTPGLLGGRPSYSSGVRRLKNKVIKIAEDKRSGLFTITVDWTDPALARQWANDYVAMVNNRLRNRAMADAQASIDYLNDQLQKTSSLQVKESLYKIIETQLKTLALANVREDYAFRVIDSAVLPDRSDLVSPKVVLDAVVGMLLGAIVLGWIGHRRRA